MLAKEKQSAAPEIQVKQNKQQPEPEVKTSVPTQNLPERLTKMVERVTMLRAEAEKAFAKYLEDMNELKQAENELYNYIGQMNLNKSSSSYEQ